MTNAEAKKILEAYIACESKKAHFECDDNCDDNCHLRYDMGTVGEYNEAINMAIKALEQEPCKDCISRQSVEEMIKAEMPERGMWEIEGDKEKETVCEVCVDLMQKLSELQPVTPQPKTVLYSGDGYADGYMVYDMAECPNCGYEYKDGDKDWGLSFCPNCGQKLNWI